jgi:2-dehydro-3-deoxyphosphogluconate aldolase / (4S)-4-hydroxy-2-oxoglutarate aldolase
MRPEEIRDRLIAERVVPVLRFASAELTERAAQCLLEVGFGAIEISMTAPHALEIIKKLKSKAIIGAGAVFDLKTARNCIDAGAQFLVSPCVSREIVQACHGGGHAAAVSGGFTPSEVLAAHRDGADIVQVFPASSGGPAHLAALHSVFPDVVLCPTGGITAANMEQYFAAGASLVGVGHAIVPLDALERGDLDAVRAHAAAYRGRCVA